MVQACRAPCQAYWIRLHNKNGVHMCLGCLSAPALWQSRLSLTTGALRQSEGRPWSPCPALRLLCQVRGSQALQRMTEGLAGFKAGAAERQMGQEALGCCPPAGFAAAVLPSMCPHPPTAFADPPGTCRS